MLAVVGIIFLGIRFLVAPQTGAQGFGVPLENGNGIAFALTKGIRDVFSGVVGLPFLLGRQRRPVAWIILTATIIPIADGFIMMKFSGFRLQFLAIHWGAALYMIVLAFFLFRPFRTGNGRSVANASQ
jgi:hypothetical protein